LLISPDGFRKFAEDAIAKGERYDWRLSHNYLPYVINSFELLRLREQIKIAPAGVRVIKMMDELSDILCSVVDLSEFVRNTHPDPLYVQVHI
jgi:hypothetical protein